MKRHIQIAHQSEPAEDDATIAADHDSINKEGLSTEPHLDNVHSVRSDGGEELNLTDQSSLSESYTQLMYDADLLLAGHTPFKLNFDNQMLDWQIFAGSPGSAPLYTTSHADNTDHTFDSLHQDTVSQSLDQPRDHLQTNMVNGNAAAYVPSLQPGQSPFAPSATQTTPDTSPGNIVQRGKQPQRLTLHYPQ